MNPYPDPFPSPQTTIGRRALRALGAGVRQHVHPGGRRAQAARRVGEKLGFHVVPRHFYSPIPDLEEIPEDIFDRRTGMAGIEMAGERQLQLIESLRSYVAEFPHHGPPNYDVENGGYESVEAELLYAIIRHHKPRRVLEVGTGYSTLVTAAAAKMNAEAGSPLRLISVDPNPYQNTSEVCDGGIGLEQRPIPVQDVPMEEFRALEAGDVNFVVLEVLPQLQPGVFVHFHDIYLPYEYPRYFVERFFWTEQYLLQAFLACNPSFGVVLAAHYLAQCHAERLASVFPSFNPKRTPS